MREEGELYQPAGTIKDRLLVSVTAYVIIKERVDKVLLYIAIRRLIEHRYGELRRQWRFTLDR